jgi:Cu-Zn family superoxide dismutase
MSKIRLFALALVLPALMWAAAGAEQGGQKEKKGDKADEARKAICIIHALKGGGKAQGVIHFAEKGKAVEITGEVTGLTPGEHAFHVHEFGDLSSPDGLTAGAHYNPKDKMHGGPDSASRHVGDLGNITADKSGKAVINISDEEIRLRGPYSVVGRAIIVHAKSDDLKSQPDGNSGVRFAGGVFGFAKAAEAGKKK